MTDESGVTVWRASHDPFGKATVTANSGVELNVRFPGQYFDGESGLHYNYFRTYDPESGRYLTSDPIGLAGGLNTFGYVYQNPLYWVDPLGLRNFGWGSPIPIQGNLRIPVKYPGLHNALNEAHDASSANVYWGQPLPVFPNEAIIEMNLKDYLDKRKAQNRLDELNGFKDTGSACRIPTNVLPTISGF